MPITPPTVVTGCHVRWPLRLYGRTVYRLITADADYVAARPPDIFDPSGQPTALNSELVAGSIVRVSHDGHGVMTAVQLLHPRFDNPFARLLLRYAQFRMTVLPGNPSGNPWPTQKVAVLLGFRDAATSPEMMSPRCRVIVGNQQKYQSNTAILPILPSESSFCIDTQHSRQLSPVVPEQIGTAQVPEIPRKSLPTKYVIQQ